MSNAKRLHARALELELAKEFDVDIHPIIDSQLIQ